MAVATNGEVEEELVDYEEEEATEEVKENKGNGKKVGYVGIHSSGFKDFLLKPELLRAIADCGFEHPSEGTIFYFSCPLNRFLNSLFRCQTLASLLGFVWVE